MLQTFVNIPLLLPFPSMVYPSPFKVILAIGFHISINYQDLRTLQIYVTNERDVSSLGNNPLKFEAWAIPILPLAFLTVYHFPPSVKLIETVIVLQERFREMPCRMSWFEIFKSSPSSRPCPWRQLRRMRQYKWSAHLLTKVLTLSCFKHPSILLHVLYLQNFDTGQFYWDFISQKGYWCVLWGRSCHQVSGVTYA